MCVEERRAGTGEVGVREGGGLGQVWVVSGEEEGWDR